MATNSEIEKLERRWQDNPLGLTFAPLAEAYRKSGEVAKALELLEVGLAQHPNYVPAHIVRGRCHVDAQQNAQAEQAFRRVTELDPENAIALKGLADLAESEGRVSEAIARLEAMLEVDRNNEDARGQLDRLRELPPPAAVPPEAEPLVIGTELDLALGGEFQFPEDAGSLSPSDESFPDIVLQAAELEKSLPVPEDAQGSDMIEEPDPEAAVGNHSLDGEPILASLAELETLELTEHAPEAELVAEPEPASEPADHSEPALEPDFEPVAELSAQPATSAAPDWETAPEPTEPVFEAAAPQLIEPEAGAEPWSEPETERASVAEPQAAEAGAGPELEPLEPEPEPVAQSEPELVVTETMAEIFLRQGHRELALAVYSQLAQRDPGNERVADAFFQLHAELAPPPAPVPPPAPASEPQRYAAAVTGGRSVAQRFAELLSATRPTVAPPVHPPTFEAARRPLGEATRPSPESLSLSSVFGEEAAPAGPAGGQLSPAAAEPSFEQFFSPAEGSSAEAELPRSPEGGAPALSSMAPEDLEQFNAWLRGLKR